jgi:hypothetical protein
MARQDPMNDSCLVVLFLGAAFATLVAGGLTVAWWWIA